MVSSVLQQALERLGSLRDVENGLPISSHRAGVGGLIVTGKKLARALGQPMINELLRKQTRFNEEALAVLRTLVLDLKSLQDGVLATHTEFEERLRHLERNVDKLAGERSSKTQSPSPLQRE